MRKFIIIDHRSLEEPALQLAKQIKQMILAHEMYDYLVDVNKVMELASTSKEVVIKAFNYLVEENIYEKDMDNLYHIIYKEIALIKGNNLLSFAEIIKAMDQILTIKTFGKNNFIYTSSYPKMLPFQYGTKVHHQKRIYFGNEFPKAYMELYFVMDILKDIDNSIYDHIPYFEIVGFDTDKTLKTSQRAQAIIIPSEINKLLKQSEGSIGLKSIEHFYNKQNELVLYSEIFLNSNYFLKIVE